MNTSNSTPRSATLVAGAIVAVTGVLSIANDWGIVMAVSLLAGVAAIVLELAPTLVLPVSRGVAAVAIGAAATATSTLVAIDWLGWIAGHLIRFDTFQFLAGLVAAIVLLVIGFGRFQAERRSAAAPAPSAA
ncbi:MAG: hypothetical protein L0227_12145 [Chloroflexi bacterium]|nr:hypothetical protein [Chloroflexota bacterium]